MLQLCTGHLRGLRQRGGTIALRQPRREPRTTGWDVGCDCGRCDFLGRVVINAAGAWATRSAGWRVPSASVSFPSAAPRSSLIPRPTWNSAQCRRSNSSTRRPILSPMRARSWLRRAIRHRQLPMTCSLRNGMLLSWLSGWKADDTVGPSHRPQVGWPTVLR